MRKKKSAGSFGKGLDIGRKWGKLEAWKKGAVVGGVIGVLSTFFIWMQLFNRNIFTSSQAIEAFAVVLVIVAIFAILGSLLSYFAQFISKSIFNRGVPTKEGLWKKTAILGVIWGFFSWFLAMHGIAMLAIIINDRYIPLPLTVATSLAKIMVLPTYIVMGQKIVGRYVLCPEGSCVFYLPFSIIVGMLLGALIGFAITKLKEAM